MAKSRTTTITLSIIIALLVIALVMLFQNPSSKIAYQEISYTRFLSLEPHLRDVVLRGDVASGHDDQNRTFTVMLPHDPAIATRLAEKNVDVVIKPADDSQGWETSLLVNGLPLIVYFFLTTWPLYRLSRALEALSRRRAAPSKAA